MNNIIISNTCVGGFIYKYTNTKYDNPFIWVIVNDEDVVYLLEHYDDINFNNYRLTSVYSKESTGRLYNLISKANRDIYGILVDEKITLWFPHYYKTRSSKVNEAGVYASGENIEEFIIQKYTDRVNGMNNDPLFILETDEIDSNDNVSNDILKLFYNTKSNYKKVLLTHNKTDFKNTPNTTVLIYPKTDVVEKSKFVVENIDEFRKYYMDETNFGGDINKVIAYLKKHPVKNMKDFAELGRMFNKKKNKEKSEIKISEDMLPIISFTTYKERMPYLNTMIQSILDNTVKPYKIVLTLYKDDVEYIPDFLQNYIDTNQIELITADEDLKAHKKYFYVMQKYRDRPIITVDDDVFYWGDLIESLVNSYKRYPDCVHARRVTKKVYNEDGSIKKYKDLIHCNKDILEPSFEIFAEGVGGVLYPPNILNITDDNLEDIYKYIYADDIYLHYLEIKKGAKCVCVQNFSNEPTTIMEAQKTGLWKTICDPNKEDNPVDIAIKELLD